MTNLESYNHATQGMTLIEQNIFAAVFVGALSAILSDDAGRRQWARALKTARNYPFAFKGAQQAHSKVESMVLADEPCPDCGSHHHRSCATVAPVGTAGLAEIVDGALARAK